MHFGALKSFVRLIYKQIFKRKTLRLFKVFKHRSNKLYSCVNFFWRKCDNAKAKSAKKWQKSGKNLRNFAKNFSKNFKKFSKIYKFRKNFTKNYFHLLCYDNKTQHINLKSKFANFFLNSFSKKSFHKPNFCKIQAYFFKVSQSL